MTGALPEEAHMTEVIVTSRTFTVEHVRIASHKPFAQVRDDLEALLPKLDPAGARRSAPGR